MSLSREPASPSLDFKAPPLHRKQGAECVLLGGEGVLSAGGEIRGDVTLLGEKLVISKIKCNANGHVF